MSKNDKDRIANVLQEIAVKLKEDKYFLSRLENFIEKDKNIKTKHGRNKKKDEIALDIFDKYSKEGQEGLRKELSNLSIENLVSIIRKYNLDQSKLSHKWKKSEKLIELIIRRVSEKMESGKSFLDYGK